MTSYLTPSQPLIKFHQITRESPSHYSRHVILRSNKIGKTRPNQSGRQRFVNKTEFWQQAKQTELYSEANYGSSAFSTEETLIPAFVAPHRGSTDKQIRTQKQASKPTNQQKGFDRSYSVHADSLTCISHLLWQIYRHTATEKNHHFIFMIHV